MYAPAQMLAKGEDVDTTAAELVLTGAIIWATENGTGMPGWEEGDWKRVLGGLDPREAVTVILHVIRGLPFEEIAEWLGVSKTRGQQLWARAIKKLRSEHSEERLP